MNFVDIIPVGAITVICLLICQIFKATPLDKKWLPAIAGVSGAILGVIGMFTIPEYPATDIISAVAVGIISGLASTGGHQIYKQLFEVEPDESEGF